MENKNAFAQPSLEQLNERLTEARNQLSEINYYLMNGPQLLTSDTRREHEENARKLKIEINRLENAIKELK